VLLRREVSTERDLCVLRGIPRGVVRGGLSDGVGGAVLGTRGVLADLGARRLLRVRHELGDGELWAAVRAERPVRGRIMRGPWAVRDGERPVPVRYPLFVDRPDVLLFYFTKQSLLETAFLVRYAPVCSFGCVIVFF
jgi:hypothetical protein